MYFAESSLHELISFFQNLNPKQTCGIDELSKIILLKSCFIVASCLTYIASLSFKTRLFPNSIKCSKVVPPYKSEFRMDLNNYQSISLLNSCSKIIEKVMHFRLYNYLEKFACSMNNFWGSSKKFGVRQKYASVDALAESIERLRLGHDKI